MRNLSAKDRRKNILIELKKTNKPIVARKLAEKYQVSRQVVVGDIALLRAGGEEILSTPKGYLLNTHLNLSTTKKIVCHHSNEETVDEIQTIVDLGGKLLDVSVEHPIYGEIHGTLNIFDKKDANNFLHKVEKRETSLLLELTKGVHTHTISADNLEIIEKIEETLKKKGYIYQE